jgi:hypothetical protein
MGPRRQKIPGLTRRSHPASAGVLVAVVLTGLAVWMALAHNTNPAAARQFVVHNFVLPEHYDRASLPKGRTNLLKALVTGKEGTPVGKDLFQIQEMGLQYLSTDGRTNLVALAPECLVDANRRELSSSGPVKAEGHGGNMSIEGVGFFCQLTNFHLIISNQVRAVIRRESSRRLIP